MYVALAIVAIHYGGGRHAATLEPENLMNAIKYTVISFAPGVLSFTTPKFAVVILLAKLLNPGRVHKTIMWCVSIAYGLFSIGMLAVNFGQCTPAAAQWDRSIGGTCWDRAHTVRYSLALGSKSSLLFRPGGPSVPVFAPDGPFPLWPYRR